MSHSAFGCSKQQQHCALRMYNLYIVQLYIYAYLNVDYVRVNEPSVII